MQLMSIIRNIVNAETMVMMMMVVMMMVMMMALMMIMMRRMMTVVAAANAATKSQHTHAAATAKLLCTLRQPEVPSSIQYHFD